MPKTPDNVFGKEMYRIRTQELRMSRVEDLAKALEVSPRTVEGYEQGSSLPSGETPWRLYALIGPDLFASLMPHIRPPQRVTLELVKAREDETQRLEDETREASVGTVGGETRADRLRAMIKLAQEVLDEET